MQAWMEVVSQMNELAKAISKPIQERKEMAEKILNTDEKDKSESSAASARYVQRYLMIPSFKAKSKNEAIEKLIENLAKEFPKYFVDVKLVKDSVFAREESMATGLDHGVVVPHGRSDGVNHIIGAVALVDNSENENGIIPDWETIDHSKVQVIVMTLMPASVQGPYLQLMAYISRMLHDGCDELLECKTSDEMRNFFKKLK